MEGKYVTPFLVIIFLLSLTTFSYGHDEWKNGGKVPDWVKASCCGPADAHHLTPNQVHFDDDFYMVDGYIRKIPRSQALPSQDGDYWIFYRGSGSDESGVYCFFVPMAF